MKLHYYIVFNKMLGAFEEHESCLGYLTWFNDNYELIIDIWN